MAIRRSITGRADHGAVIAWHDRGGIAAALCTDAASTSRLIGLRARILDDD